MIWFGTGSCPPRPKSVKYRVERAGNNLECCTENFPQHLVLFPLCPLCPLCPLW